MNYIKQLQEENKELKSRIDNTDNMIREFKGYLITDKFNGYDQDGDRLDWISRSELTGRLGLLEECLFNINQ
tara:strand:+ start:730 stop:945 length:216 start_codon:yes stop_codon:yes gene_type:complete